MPPPVETFRIGDPSARGLTCNELGLFVGPCALLQKVGGSWQARSLQALSAELGDLYGLPIDLTQKINGIEAVAHALDRGDTHMRRSPPYTFAFLTLRGSGRKDQAPPPMHGSFLESFC